MATVSEILANTVAYGFEFFSDKVAKAGMDLGLVPLVRHLDVDKLRAEFGDRFFLDSADGTSRHVTNQRIARDMKYADRGTTELAIRTAIVENMKGIKSRKTVVTETKYRAKINGVWQLFNTELEADQAVLVAEAEAKISE